MCSTTIEESDYRKIRLGNRPRLETRWNVWDATSGSIMSPLYEHPLRPNDGV